MQDSSILIIVVMLEIFLAYAAHMVKGYLSKYLIGNVMNVLSAPRIFYSQLPNLLLGKEVTAISRVTNDLEKEIKVLPTKENKSLALTIIKLSGSFENQMENLIIFLPTISMGITLGVSFRLT